MDTEEYEAIDDGSVQMTAHETCCTQSSDPQAPPGAWLGHGGIPIENYSLWKRCGRNERPRVVLECDGEHVMLQTAHEWGDRQATLIPIDTFRRRYRHVENATGR